MKIIERFCKICGRKFESERNNKKYCDECKNFSDYTKATGLFYNCEVQRRKRNGDNRYYSC